MHLTFVRIFNKLDTKVCPHIYIYSYEYNNLGLNKNKNYIVTLMFLYRIYVLLYLK